VYDYLSALLIIFEQKAVTWFWRVHIFNYVIKMLVFKRMQLSIIKNKIEIVLSFLIMIQKQRI